MQLLFNATQSMSFSTYLIQHYSLHKHLLFNIIQSMRNFHSKLRNERTNIHQSYTVNMQLSFNNN